MNRPQSFPAAPSKEQAAAAKLLSEPEMFWRNVQRSGPDQCWPWTACRVPCGYGKLQRVIDGRKRRFVASRVAWLLHHGEWPNNLVCHTCDNPACCNPAHLFDADPRTNKADELKKGRHPNAAKRSCIRGHEFTPENTYRRPDGGRGCRQCIAHHQRAYTARKKVKPQQPFTIGEPVGRPIRSVRPLCVHRMANATYDEEMIAALFERMNGPPRHVDLDPRVHWTTYPLTIAAVCVALIFVLQLCRSYLAGLLA